MKYAAIALIFCSVSCGPVPASAVEVANGQLVVTTEELKTLNNCDAQGGCLIVTKSQLDAIMIAVARMTATKVAASCKKDSI